VLEAALNGQEGDVEVRMLVGAGPRLRHDPRAIAVLVGWASRLGPVRSDSE
jgi:putative redox protein